MRAAVVALTAFLTVPYVWDAGGVLALQVTAHQLPAWSTYQQAKWVMCPQQRLCFDAHVCNTMKWSLLQASTGIVSRPGRSTKIASWTSEVPSAL